MIMSSGQLGYDDWQEQGEWHAPAMLFSFGGNITGDYNNGVSPNVYDCSRFGFIVVQAQCTVQNVNLTVDFYSQQSRVGFYLGGSTASVDFTNSAQLTWNVGCTGPWVWPRVHAPDQVTQYNLTFHALLSNVTIPRPTYCGGQGTINFNNQTIPANGTLTLIPQDYFGGEVALSVNGGNQGFTAVFSVWDLSNSYITFFQQTYTAGLQPTQRIVWPIGAVKCVLTNTSAVNPCTGVNITGVSNVGNN